MLLLQFDFNRLSLVVIISMVLLTHLSGSRLAYSGEVATEGGRSWALRDPQEQQRSFASLRERAGFIARDKAFLGTIYHAMGEARLLQTGDLALIDIGADRELQVGEFLTIFSMSPVVRHTQTGALIGRPARMLGIATLVRVEESTAMIRITEVFDEILIGDRVERYGVLPPPAPSVEPSVKAVLHTDAESVVGSIQSAKDDKLALAAGDIVFIDQGAWQGVEPGDRFLVYNERRIARHPDTNRVLPVAPQPIGELRIVDVQPDSSTAHVETSWLEFGVGAMVRLASRSGGSAYDLASASAVEALLLFAPPCLEQARAAMRAAKAAGVQPPALVEAEHALAYAATTFEQAQALVEQGNREQAHQLLQAVEADCLRAQQLASEMNWQRAAQFGDRYTVQPGDSLWSIAARPAIYQDPLLWPILYQGNRDRLDDPDMIAPRQELAVPRGYSQDEANMARQRARHRGPWRLGDGPDTYILEGFQP